MDPETMRDLLERLGNTEAPLNEEELASLRAAVAEQIASVDRTNPSDDDLAVLRDARTAITAIDAEQAVLADAAAGRAAEAAALLDGLDLPEPVAETVEETQEETPEAGDAPAEDAPAEDAPAEGETAEIVEPLAAAGVFNARPAAQTRPAMGSLARRARAGAHRPRATATDDSVAPARDVIRASGSMPGITPGQPVSLREWADGAANLWSTLRSIDAPDGEQMIRLGQVRHSYPDEWMLGTDEVANERKLAAAASARNQLLASGGSVTESGARLTASGGICGPVGVDYTVTTIGSAVRPARDGLVQIGAGRGGLRYIRPHTLENVHADAPASIWTQATDAAPGNSTKGRATYVCQTPVEDTVDAVVSRVKLGNFQARYFVEQVDEYMATIETEHARLADGTLLGQMLTGSKLVTGALNLTGAASEFFAHVDLACAGYRWRHRMAPDAPLDFWLPEWFEDELRADFARELPGNSGGQSERMAVADAEIDRMFAVRSLNIVDYLDNPTGANPAQSWVTQGVGALLPWPTKVLFFLFHPGAWAFLDGGEFNFGLVRDSTLNNTNDAEYFSESLEKAIFRGHESIALLLDLCPFGGRAGTVDATSLCTSGS